MTEPKSYVLKLADGRDEPIKDLDGASRTILIDEKTVNANEITFGHSRYEPKTSIHKKHFHRNAEEIMYILSGRGVAGVNDQETVVTQGDNNAAPDSEPVRAENLVGRVCFVEREGKTRTVWGGRAGRLWVVYLRLRRRIVRLGRWPYRFLRASGIVQRLWRPRVVQVRLATESGPLVKYIHGQRTVARWLPEEKQFWCRKPYDLVIERPSEAAEP